jgi:YHS domain-containing protein
MFGKRDPVCGVKVSKKSKYFAEYGGKTYYFDCEGCKLTFEADPESFIKKKSGRGFLRPPKGGSGDVPRCCHDMKK